MSKKAKIFLLGLFIILVIMLFPAKVNASTPYDNPAFDGEFYLNNYSDLKNAFGSDYKSAYNHFITFGVREGRQASLCFDVKYYLNYYEDLSKAYQGNYAEAYNHFMTFGIKEGRKSSPYFDVKYYLNYYGDLSKAYQGNYAEAYNHFMTFGIKEGRRGSEYFDIKYYLDNNSDLKKTFQTNYKSAYEHYLTFGIKEGRNPSEKVNIKCYLNSYIDLQKAFAKNYRNVAEHYYLFGVKEGRKATHTIIEVGGRKATCTEKGLTAEKKCKTCGEVIEKSKELPKINHDYKVVETKNATCTENGYTKYECTMCKQIKQETISATGHDEKDAEVTKKPTCESTGTKVYKCSKCGETVRTEEIPSTGHNWEKKDCTWTDITSAKATFICKNDGSHKKEVEDKSPKKTKETATCENDGETEYTATFELDGKTYTDKKTEETKAFGHNWGDWKKENGKYYRECSRCKKKEEGIDSKFTITKELPESVASTIKKQFEDWGFKPESIKDFQTYKDGLKIEKVENDDHTVKVTGLLPLMKLTEGAGFGDEAKEEDGYYFVYVIKTEKSVGKNGSGENTYQKVEVKIPQNGEDGMNPTKILTKEAFDTDNEMAVLMKIAPKEDKANQKFKVIVDIDGNEKTCAPYEITVDYSGLEFQEQSNATISIDENEIKESDKEILKDYGYKLLNDIEISEENEDHTDGRLEYDSETGLLSGTIPEQKLKAGFAEEDLDSYFYTYTIKPTKYTDNIKVTVKGPGTPETETYDKNDFAEGVLTILQHIPKGFEKCQEESCCNGTGKCTDGTKCSKAIEITIDSDGDNNKYTESETYYIDYCNVDFVDLHTVTFQKNDGSTISTEDVYDGEKVTKPTDPEKEKHLNDVNQYNKFDHWNVKSEDGQDMQDEKFEFGENGKSNEAISEDVTLYPIWEIDVDQYITDAITKVNEFDKEKNGFEIEKKNSEDGNTLTVEIINREKKIEEITDTIISKALQHALESGEIKSIEIELTEGNASEKFEASDKNVAEKLKKFFTEKVFTEDGTNKNLSDLCTQCTGKELELTIDPADKVAQIKGKSEKASAVYTIKFEKEIEIKFNAGALESPKTEYIKPDELSKREDSLPTPAMKQSEQEYRTFDGWYNDKSTMVTKFNEIVEDTELTAHYTLNVDKFVDAVVNDLKSTDTTYSDNFTEKMDLSKSGNNITIDIKSPNLPVSELAETSIPGTIAYILQKEEIKDVTLGFNGNSEKFDLQYKSNGDKEYDKVADRDSELLGTDGINLKKEIIKGAKDIFDTELSNKEENVTLDQLEYTDKLFTIKIGEPTSDAIKLVKDENETELEELDKTYTFKFDSDFAVVNSNPESELGARKIKDVLDKTDYNTIYIDGDIEETNTLNITKNITIEAVPQNESQISLASNTQIPTISVKEQDCVIDVQSGNVTISDLKLTGGKKSELKVAEGATVTVDNVDVSADITPSEKLEDSDQMNAAVLVEGNLIVKNIRNDKENYKIPTIATVTSWEFPKDPVVSDKESESGKEETASVTLSGINMTKNGSYNIVTKNKLENIDSVEETYYGSFYYLDKNNSQIYFAGIMDPNKKARPYDYIKIYYYDEQLDFDSLGYRPGEEPEDVEDDKKGSVVFKNFTLSSNKNVLNGNERVQEVLQPHTTNIVYVNYDLKPSTVVNIPEVSGLSSTENTISGTLMEQNEKDGKYYIPVTLTSDKYISGTTTVKVTNPNNVTTNYKYNGTETLVEENRVSAMSISDLDSKTVKLNLEAIKSSKITGDNGKVYEIAVDVDGEDNDKYQEETYTIDYNEVKTEEEIILQAAKNTQEAKNFTVEKDNKIKGLAEKYTMKKDKENETQYYTENDDKTVQYTFPEKTVNPDKDTNKKITVEKSDIINQPIPNRPDLGDRPKLNDWTYFNQFDKVVSGIHELELLKDIVSGNEVTDAIKTVRKSEDGEHTYTITISSEKLGEWLNGIYMDGKLKENEVSDNNYSSEIATLNVTLDANEQYVTEIKTVGTFTISKPEISYDDNTIDVKITEIGTTSIETPQKILGLNGVEATNEQIQDFIQNGRNWWSKYIKQ